jgi:hypothetical protein
MMADVDACFFHHFYGFGIEFSRCIRSCRPNGDSIVQRLQKSFRHLASTTVSGTKN